MYDDKSIDVIVPYEGGKAVIADLDSRQAAQDLKYRKACIERAKPYTISLYEYQRRQLEQMHGLRLVGGGDSGIWMLADGSYDNETGFSLKGREMQFLEV